MTTKNLPNSKLIYGLALFSFFIFCFAGIGIVPATIAFVLAIKSERIYAIDPNGFANYSAIKKGKVMAIIGIVLNLIIVGIAIWTLSTIGWDAWSDEFVRRWNEGLESGGNY